MSSSSRPSGQRGEDRIVSIATAAPGWVACYSDPDSPGEESELAVAVWALMEDDQGQTWVAGIEPNGFGADGRPADEMGNFSQYQYRPN